MSKWVSPSKTHIQYFLSRQIRLDCKASCDDIDCDSDAVVMWGSNSETFETALNCLHNCLFSLYMCILSFFFEMLKSLWNMRTYQYHFIHKFIFLSTHFYMCAGWNAWSCRIHREQSQKCSNCKKGTRSLYKNWECWRRSSKNVWSTFRRAWYAVEQGEKTIFMNKISLIST